MDVRRYFDVISGREHGWRASLLRTCLALAVPGYALAVAVRNWLFDVGIRPQHTAKVPVVSVGNLTTGGTGKTPIVAWIAAWFGARGIRPCLISRGFRSIDASGNDELRVLAQLCPDVPHIQKPDRVAGAREAVDRYAADVVILDDGFQHRRLRRNLDIVLIDATQPWGFGHLLPRGLLREPRSALRRADVVVLTRVDLIAAPALANLRHEVREWMSGPVVEAAFRPALLTALSGGTADLHSLTGQTVAAFCGIGNPSAFGQTLLQAGISVDPAALITFPDHHHYTRDELRSLAATARSRGAAALVTTQKDLVKLDSAWAIDLPVWAVTLGVEIVSGHDEWERLLSSCLPLNRREPS